MNIRSLSFPILAFSLILTANTSLAEGVDAEAEKSRKMVLAMIQSGEDFRSKLILPILAKIDQDSSNNKELFEEFQKVLALLIEESTKNGLVDPKKTVQHFKTLDLKRALEDLYSDINGKIFPEIQMAVKTRDEGQLEKTLIHWKEHNATFLKLAAIEYFYQADALAKGE